MKQDKLPNPLPIAFYGSARGVLNSYAIAYPVWQFPKWWLSLHNEIIKQII